MFGSGSAREWACFAAIVAGLLALDLAAFHRRARTVSVKDAAIWTVVWTALALMFNLGVLWKNGAAAGADFFTAYVVERSLSIDNLFVFLAIFQYFRIPDQYQHRALFWGVVAALALRAVFIGAGAALLQTFDWLMIPFGAFLLYTAAKIARSGGVKIEPGESLAVRAAKKRWRFTDELTGPQFFVVRDGVRLATPLLLAVIVIEFSDLLFAFDSVPAVLGVTRDAFIVYTSNIFAVLGLRAMYFLVAGLMRRLRFLHVGLALVLAFIGGKMILNMWVVIPSLLSLAIVIGLLAAAIAASRLAPAAGQEPGR